MEVLQRQHDLPGVVGAAAQTRRLPGRLHSGKEQAHKPADDRDHDQQFHKRKTTTLSKRSRAKHRSSKIHVCQHGCEPFQGAPDSHGPVPGPAAAAGLSSWNLTPPVVAILQKQDTGVIARKGDAATPVRHGMCASHSLITGLLRFCWVRNTGSLARASGLPGTPLHPSPQRERGNTGRLQIRCRTGVGRSTAPLWRPSPFARPLSVR